MVGRKQGGKEMVAGFVVCVLRETGFTHTVCRNNTAYLSALALVVDGPRDPSKYCSFLLVVAVLVLALGRMGMARLSAE